MHSVDAEAIQTNGNGHGAGTAHAAAQTNGVYQGPESETAGAAAQLDLAFADRRLSAIQPGTEPAAGGGQSPPGDDEIVLPTLIVKRDGREVPFDPMRIERALLRCFAALGREPYTPLSELALRVVNIMAARRGTATVEAVQDAVELTLQAAGEFEAAKAYILYRAEHAKQRVERPIPDEVRAAFAEADRYFPTALQKFQYFDKYSRFDYDKGRRETWIETVDRSVAYLHELVQTNAPGVDLGGETFERIRRFILEMKSMPSMRLLAMAGAPARRNNVTIYNCSYQPVESIDSFVEALLISMSGCGVGYSVESAYVERFPRVKRQQGAAPTLLVVEDSAEGWGHTLRTAMEHWFEGHDVRFDFSLIRPAGAPLRTKGGRASGPGPLQAMLEFTRGRILARQGMHLRPLDAHDIMCAVGNAAVSGGVRRCLPAGTRVHTSRGAVPIEEVREGDRVMTDSGYKPVTGWVDQGVQDVVEIVTESGTVFRCTPHHRVAVLADVWGGHRFKYARDLTPDDRLVFITHPIDGEIQPLAALPPKRAADHSGSVVRQPVLDVETAWFLGKFFADGYAQVGTHDAAGKRGNTQFSVACHLQETEQIDRVTAWMEHHGLQVQRLLGKGQWLTLRSSNRQVARWMQHYKRPGRPLQVPEVLWRAPGEIRAAFVAGLMDGDGCFTDQPVTVLSTVYEPFGREVVKLLATLGVVAEIRQRRPATDLGWQAQWIVTVKDAHALRRAEQVVGAQACTPWVARHGKQAGYTVPGWMVKRDVPRQDWASLWPSGRDASMNSATLTAVVQATHYVPVAVREVRAGGPAHTYDIEVRDGSMFVAEGYLVHNTAMISLFDFDDLEMRNCKSGDFERENSQRWNANNSAVWPEGGLSQMQILEQVMDMVKSERGEPGIFNRQAALDLRPARRAALDGPGGPPAYGTNPSLRRGTLVYTAEGIVPIETLEGQQFLVRNLDGRLSPAQCFLSGRDQPLYKIVLKGGHVYYATAEHKWPIRQSDGSTRKVTTEALRRGMQLPITRTDSLGFGTEGDYEDGFLAGWLLGDGWMIQRGDNGKWQYGWLLSERDYAACFSQRIQGALRRLGVSASFQQRERDASVWYELNTQSAALDDWADSLGVRPKRQGLPLTVWTTASEPFRKGLVDGLFSADGSVDCTKQPGYPVLVLTSAHRKLVEDVSALLGFYGLKTSVRESSATSRFPNGKDYERTYTRYGLTISGMDDVQHFAATFRLSHPEKGAKLAQRRARVQPHRGTDSIAVLSVERSDLREDVWDISVLDDTHCFQLAHCITGNCGEIILRPWELCNLSIAVARQEDTLESLREKVEVAALIGTLQSLATSFPGLRPMWAENCRQERLLGVDITGQLDSPAAQDPAIQRTLRDVAVETNRAYAERLGINQSASVTCVKPSGNSSQLLNCSSGLHARWAPYYERNVRVAATSPIFKVLKDAGVPMDPENGQTPDTAHTWVIHFPVKSPDGAITRKDRSAIDQCEYWLQNKLHWTEHNPSVTVTYQPEEVLDLMKWIWEHRDKLGGMAFLPSFDAQYAQLPYIEISREEYERRAAAFPAIDFSKLYRYENEDLTNAAQELACVAGQCET